MTESGTPSDPGTPATPGWQAPPPPTAPVAGAPGFVYADVPNRIIALIIDSIILGIVNIIIFGVMNGILGLGLVSFLASLVVGLAISAGYFTYTWTAMRGTIGMKALGMQIGNAGDGRPSSRTRRSAAGSSCSVRRSSPRRCSTRSAGPSAS